MSGRFATPPTSASSQRSRWRARQASSRGGSDSRGFPSLLVIDELGYLSIPRTGAMIFFQIMSRRYEHARTVRSSRNGFEQ